MRDRENMMAEVMWCIAEREEYLVRRELVLAFDERRPERSVQLPPRGWWDQSTRIVNLEALEIDHVYL